MEGKTVDSPILMVILKQMMFGPIPSAKKRRTMFRKTHNHWRDTCRKILSLFMLNIAMHLMVTKLLKHELGMRRQQYSYIFSVDQSGVFASAFQHENVEVRREGFDWYRGYDRKKLLEELKSLYAAAAD